MNTKAIHQVKIDVETKFVKPFMAALGKLKTTLSLENNGEYMFPGPTGYSLLSYTGELDADGIDEWAGRVKAGAGFVGAIAAQEAESYGSIEVSANPVKFTSAKNDKGDLIASNPATAQVYAELDYYGMAKARDTRSRNKREGGYCGRYKAGDKNFKMANYRVGPKGEYATLKETTRYKKQHGL